MELYRSAGRVSGKSCTKHGLSLWVDCDQDKSILTLLATLVVVVVVVCMHLLLLQLIHQYFTYVSVSWARAPIPIFHRRAFQYNVFQGARGSI